MFNVIFSRRAVFSFTFWIVFMEGRLNAEPAPVQPTSQSAATTSRATANREDDLRLDSDLVAEGLANSGEVIVIEGSSKKAAPSATGREISQNTISKTPRRSTDDLLRLVPGLYTSQHASEGKAQQFFLRGFDAVHGSDIEISVAGIPVNEMSNIHGHGYVDIGFVPPETVLGITAKKGAFSAEQGNFATAGSVGLSLGVATPRRGARVSYEAGTTQRQRVMGLWAPEQQADQNFIAVDALADKGFGQNRGTERISAIGQRRFYLPGAFHHVDTLLVGYAARFGEASTTPLANVQSGAIGYYDTYDQISHGRSNRALAVIAYHREENDNDSGQENSQGEDTRASRKVNLSFEAGWRSLQIEENNTGFLISEELGDRKRQNHDVFTAGVRGSYDRRVGKLRLNAGGSTRVEQIEQSDFQITDAGVPWRRNLALTGVQSATGLFSSATYRLGDFAFSGGGRFDLFGYFPDEVEAGELAEPDAQEPSTGFVAQLSPRLSATYFASKRLKIFAGYGRGLRSPELRGFANRSVQQSQNGAVRPEVDITSADSAEVNATYRFGQSGSIGLAVFGVRIENEMVFDHLNGMTLARNATQRLGAEATAQLTPTPWLAIRSDVSFVDARFTDSRAFVPGVPRLMASLDAQLGNSMGPNLGITGRFLAPRPLAHGARGASQAVVNLLAGYRWSALSLILQVDNALGSRWREGEYHYASWFDKSLPRSEVPRLHYAPGRPFGARASITAWF